MHVFRISKTEYKKDLTGVGAALYGGRWNPKGLHMVYTAGNIALAYVEFLVHNYHIIGKDKVSMACINVPDSVDIQTISENELPSDWNRNPESIAISKDIGKAFLQNSKHYILKVPSAIVPGEFNFLLNPKHKNHNQTIINHYIDPFEYDERLLKKL